ncbi:MAG TPA: hypothetical protein PKZ75_06835 [Bacteroidia bacterium]|nr:hypothetical protein [Bacteroidia bacterium]
MSGKYNQVTYVTGFKKDDETGTVEPIFKTKKVVVASTKRFNNNLHKTANLPPAARNLIDYLVQKMNDANEVQNTFLVRQDFIDTMKHCCKKKYKEVSVNKAFQVLKANDLLIPYVKKRGVYIVNPHYFFNGSFKSRKLLIQRMLSNVNNHEIVKKALGFE